MDKLKNGIKSCHVILTTKFDCLSETIHACHRTLTIFNVNW